MLMRQYVNNDFGIVMVQPDYGHYPNRLYVIFTKSDM